MDKLLYNAYRFSSANSTRIENGNGTNNLGAITPDGRYGFDCSGFVNYLLTKSGYQIDKYTSTGNTINADGSLKPPGAQWQQTIDTNQARQGDLVYFQGHVGIVVSYDSNLGLGVFRSSTTSYGVNDAPFTTVPASGLTYWGTGGKQFVGFTRVTAENNRDNDIWRSTTNTSALPPLEAAPALPSASNSNPSGYASSWLTQTAWIESRGVTIKNKEDNGLVAYSAENGNALGKYQMKETQSLVALGYTNADGTWREKNGINSRADFLKNGAEQEKAAVEYVGKLRSELTSNGAMAYIGKTIGGHLITEEGLLGAAWEGAGRVKQLLVMLSNPVDYDNVGMLYLLSRMDSYRGTLAPGMAGASVATPTGGAAGLYIGPTANNAYSGTGTASHHADGSTTYQSEIKADSADGRYKKGDIVSTSFDKDPTNGINFDSETIWRTDGTVYQRSLSADKSQETIVEWRSDGVKARQITKDIAARAPIGEFIKEGQRYDESGAPILSADYVGPPLENVNPYTLLDALPASMPSESNRAQEASDDWTGDNFGLDDIDLSQIMLATQVGFSPGVDTNTAAKLEALMVAEGYEVTRDANGIYASKGGKVFSFTTDAMTFQNGNEWAAVARTVNGEMVSGSHLGVNERAMYVDIGGAHAVLLGHLSGNVDDLGEAGSNAFVIDQVTSINGQSPYGVVQLNAALANTNLTLDDLLSSGDASGALTQLLAFADPQNLTGLPPVPTFTSGLPWYNDTTLATQLNDAQAILAALKSGKPLPIASSIWGAASHITGIPAVDSIAAGLSTVSNLKQLAKALEVGDVGQVAISTTNLISNALQIQYAVLQTQLAAATTQAARESLITASAANRGLAETLGKGLTVLSFLNAAKNNDLNGAVISAVGYFFPVAGAILSLADTFLAPFFSGNKNWEADGRFQFQADPNGNVTGKVVAVLGGHNNGAEAAWTDLMATALKNTQTEVTAKHALYGTDFGIIAERMPHISLKRGVMVLWYTDPLTAIEYARTFDLQGKYLAPGYIEDIDTASPYGTGTTNAFARVGRDANPADMVDGNQVALTGLFYKNVFEQFSDLVAASGAIAPLWEVQTFNEQRKTQVNLAAGDKTVGLTTQEVAKKNGDLYATRDGGIGDGLQGFSPIVLDLDLDGTLTTFSHIGRPGALFDVDNDGYAEETDWIGPRDGILVLDRNGDGAIDTGQDLFNDTRVKNTQRGLNVLGEIDAQWGGLGAGVHLDSSDPVFQHLKVWTDIDGNGITESNELKTLAQLGITAVDVSPVTDDGHDGIGSFVQNGVRYGGTSTSANALNDVYLYAEVEGATSTKVGNSLLYSTENGQTNVLLALSAFDFGKTAATSTGHVHTSSNGVLTATDELIDSQEDYSIVISVEQLLGNDKSTAGPVTFGHVVSSQNGTASYDYAKQTVTFAPTENFYSKLNQEAWFVYEVTDASNNTVQAKAVVSIGAFDDAATAEIVWNKRRAVWEDVGVVSENGVTAYLMPDLTGDKLGAEFGSPWLIRGWGNVVRAGAEIATGRVGFYDGKVYYAAVNDATKRDDELTWREVWVADLSRGVITATDADGTTPAIKSVPGYMGQFGTAAVFDNGGGTGAVSYTRTSYFSTAAQTVFRADSEIVIPGSMGPDDAFYVSLQQQNNGSLVRNDVKFVVGAPGYQQTPEANGSYVSVSPGTSTGTPGDTSSPPGVLVTQDGSAVVDRPTKGKPRPEYIAEDFLPIVLDLNGNGFRFTSISNTNAFFDTVGDGVRRAVAWTSGKDGMLAYDANGDGKISGKAELSFKGYYAGATTDLEGLRHFDSNGDGKFSSADALWSKFYVWQDINEDGNQTAEELFSLTDRGIGSINLTTDHVASALGGVAVRGVGSYTRIDGTEAALADVALAYSTETFDSIRDDTIVMTSNADAVETHAGNDQVTGTTGDDSVYLGAGNDVFYGGAGNEVATGDAGDDYLSGEDDDDELWGGIGNDVVLGGAGSDALHGGAGADSISGGTGDDELWGNSGDDVLSGGEGVDTYYYDSGDGNDTIYELAGDATRIVLGASLVSAGVQTRVFSEGRGYQLTFANGQTLTFNSVSNDTLVASGVQVKFGDGAIGSLSQLAAGIPPVNPNHAPTVAAPLVQQAANQDSSWTYVVPAATFADQDAGDTLIFSAKLANGQAMPSWLSFNGTTRTFTGTPTTMGTLNLLITAVDKAGASVSAPLVVAVAAPLDKTAPTLGTTTPGDNTTAVVVGSNVVLKYSEAIKAGAGTIKLVNAGNAADMRSISITDTSQITIAGDTLTINPTADLAAGASYSVQMPAGTVTDLAGNAYAGIDNSTALNFTTNFAPTVAAALTQQTANQNNAWSYVVPVGTFADQDVGDTLVYTAKLANGDALPSWLSFNATTRTFTGTPANVGTINLQVTATDAAGAKVSTALVLAVAAPLDATAPTLSAATPVDNATAVAIGANVVLKFSEAIKAGSGSLKLVNAGNAADTRTISVTDTTQVTIAGDTLTLNPTADLMAGASYSVQMPSGTVKDLAGNAYAGIGNSTDLNFATAANVPNEPQPPAGALVGTPGKDVLTADSAHKEVWGLGDNDTINGFWDSTHLVGGAGNDTINAVGGAANILDGGAGDDILKGAWGKDTLIGGEGNNTIVVNGGDALVTAGSGNDTITGSWGNDSISAGSGTNTVNAGGGNNNVRTGAGNDLIQADSGNDVINAGDGTNSVTAGEGMNLVWTGAGVDTIAAFGTNVVLGGAGNDKVTLGWGNDWVEAGKGDDLIDAGGGTNLIAFNKGDGADTLISGNWSTDTISLGQGIRYADMKLSKSGNDLILSFTQGDQMNLKAWYANAANRGVGKLQVLTVGGEYDTTSASALKNRPVTVFDFTKLVAAFDAARAANATAANGWNLSGSLTSAQLYATATPPTSSSYVNPWAALQAGTALMDSAPTTAIQPFVTATQGSVDQLLFAALNSSGVAAAAGWTRP